MNDNERDAKLDRIIAIFDGDGTPEKPGALRLLFRLSEIICGRGDKEGLETRVEKLEKIILISQTKFDFGKAVLNFFTFAVVVAGWEIFKTLVMKKP